MDFLLHLSPLVYSIAAGAPLFVLLAVFATDNLASVVSQLFEIIGRLVNDAARELEAAAHTLIGLLASVLNLRAGRQPTPARAAEGAGAPGQSGQHAQPAAAG
ncbi:MAG TPA: hypothetical protein VGR57_06740, partial [Ktedonobacterales bacterium]|nr:hypothetical protein [Ktedonobacterales bacterium]